MNTFFPTGGGGGGGVSSDFGNGLFGDGSSGAATIVGTVTLTEEKHYTNLTISTGANLKVGGFRVFVSGLLTIDSGGSINDDGNSSTSQAGGVLLGARGYLSATSGQGGNGVVATTASFSNGGAGSAASSNSKNNLDAFPVGGAGGASSTNTGGLAGTCTQVTTIQKWSGRVFDGRWTGGGFGGGSGGGGGATRIYTHTSGTWYSGGGGSGGGIVWVAAKTVANSGRISADGGKGGNAQLAVGDGNCGGGGGGGGGLATLITKSQVYGTVTALGGIGGLPANSSGGTGTALSGVNGAVGNSNVVVLS
jgi:hypothetical protein